MDPEKTIVRESYEALVDRLREENTILKEQLGICQIEIQRLSPLQDFKPIGPGEYPSCK